MVQMIRDKGIFDKIIPSYILGKYKYFFNILLDCKIYTALRWDVSQFCDNNTLWVMSKLKMDFFLEIIVYIYAPQNAYA